jgi:predicted acetyltransferase
MLKNSTTFFRKSFILKRWEWEIEGVRLKVAEMGIVGTQEPHRGKGFMGMLAREFDRTLLDEGWDLAVIQGIPGSTITNDGKNNDIN